MWSGPNLSQDLDQPALAPPCLGESSCPKWRSLNMLLTSEGRMERGSDRQIGAVAALMRSL